MTDQTQPAPNTETLDQTLTLTNATGWQTFTILARGINLKNGWGVAFTIQAVPIYLALIHSEITEAANEVDLSAIANELADVIIRCADFSELLAPGAFGYYMAGSEIEPATYRGASTSLALLELHGMTSAALEAYRKTHPLSDMVEEVVLTTARVAARSYALARLLIEQGHMTTAELALKDVSARLWGKLDANRHRGYRHGNRRI